MKDGWNAFWSVFDQDKDWRFAFGFFAAVTWFNVLGMLLEWTVRRLW